MIIMFLTLPCTCTCNYMLKFTVVSKFVLLLEIWNVSETCFKLISKLIRDLVISYFVA